MKQLAAIVASVALIAGAWFLTRDGSDDSNDSGDSSFTIYCATEIEEVCDRIDGLDANIEDPGTTLDLLVAMAPSERRDIIWVVSEPWPELLDLAISDGGTASTRTRSDPIGFAEVAIAQAESADDLAASCTDDFSWECATESIAATKLRTAIAPTTTTAGVLGVVAVANGLFGNANYKTNDLSGPTSGEIVSALETIAQADGNQLEPTDPFGIFATKRGAFDLAIGLTTTGEAVSSDRYSLATPTPAVLAALVVDMDESVDSDDARAQLGGSGDAESFIDALGKAGWSDGDADTATSVPEAGVVSALLKKWNGLRG